MSAIGSASSAGSHAQLTGQIGIAVAGKVQDAAKAQGEAIVSLLQDATAAAKQAPSEPGKGGLLDLHA